MRLALVSERDAFVIFVHYPVAFNFTTQTVFRFLSVACNIISCIICCFGRMTRSSIYCRNNRLVPWRDCSQNSRLLCSFVISGYTYDRPTWFWAASEITVLTCGIYRQRKLRKCHYGWNFILMHFYSLEVNKVEQM